MAFEQTGKQTGIQGHANGSRQEHDDKDEKEKVRAE